MNDRNDTSASDSTASLTTSDNGMKRKDSWTSRVSIDDKMYRSHSDSHVLSLASDSNDDNRSLIELDAKQTSRRFKLRSNSIHPINDLRVESNVEKIEPDVEPAFGAKLNEDFLHVPTKVYPTDIDENNSETDVASERDPLEDYQTLYFRDGKRRIDMILVYEVEDLGVMTESESIRTECRRVFQENLVTEGLELEVEAAETSFDRKTAFVKIHIPWKTKIRYAEVMNLKLPVKRFIIISANAWRPDKDESTIQMILTPFEKLKKYLQNKFFLSKYIQDEEPSFFSIAQQNGDPEEQFVVKDRETSYTNAQRSLIVMQILLRTKFDDTERAGIRRLVNFGAYKACYPLHEGPYDRDLSGELTDRRKLYLEWSRAARWFKKQPVCLIRRYFGDKIAFYFCWLGFYTKMLYYPAVVGTVCFLYGVLSMNSKGNIPSREICDPNGPGNITLCPLCDKACQYEKLRSSCLYAQMSYLFDNVATVLFSIFMSIWATTFLEAWKRKKNVIAWEWDLKGAEQDAEPRPEFESNVKTFRMNPVTHEKEPYLPTKVRAFRVFVTGSAVLFMIVVVLIAVLGTIIYRISLVSVIYATGGPIVRKHAKIVSAMSAAGLNLLVIMLLTRIYNRIALALTAYENPRTQTEFEDSFTFKSFIFEFMNFYSSLIYIAFFKGRFFSHPGDHTARGDQVSKIKGDICDPAGCLSELCIQLAIIMIGKQTLNNIFELLTPLISNWYAKLTKRSALKDLNRPLMRWEEDYQLESPGQLFLFDEYLEMIIQYGFVTLFVAAFPLAPLFALLNNIVEIRVDAYKMVTQARRPLAERVEDIGAWYGILKGITYVAVVTNAFVIAYTSEFIPRMIYMYVYSEDGTLTGYIDASLSLFNTSHYLPGMGADDDDPDTPKPELCQYRGYRNDAGRADQYELSSQYWHIFAARLVFVVVFEHFIFALTGVMQYIIPDIPTELKTQIQRETLLAREAKYEHELRKHPFDTSQIISAMRGRIKKSVVN